MRWAAETRAAARRGGCRATATFDGVHIASLRTVWYRAQEQSSLRRCSGHLDGSSAWFSDNRLRAGVRAAVFAKNSSEM